MRDRLILVAIVVFVVVALGWAFNGLYFEPAQSAAGQLRALGNELAELQAREQRIRAEVSQAGIGDTAALVASIADIAPTPASSSERLQEVVRNAVAEFGGQPISLQSSVSELGGGYAKASLLLRVRFDEAGLLAFLHKLESRMPVVLVEALEVQLLPIPGEMRSLDVTATLVGIHANVAAS